MWRHSFISLLFILIAPTGLAENYVFEGLISSADGVFPGLTPIGTEVRAFVTVAETAVSNGTATSSDIEQVYVSFGEFCFHYQTDCIDGVDIPIWTFIDTAVTFDQDGAISGGYMISHVTSPVFSPGVIVTFDFTANTLIAGHQSVGFAAADGEYFASVLEDVDDDGIIGEFDNCIMTSNPEQRDTDNDGFGNACDPDLDNNCVINFWDAYRFSTFFGTTVLNADFDGLTGVTFLDYAILISYFGSPPGPSAFASCS